MKLIAHRGNINGEVFERENSPSYLQEALDAGFDIEVDLWKTVDGLFLGHDRPEYSVDETIFTHLDPKRSWWHAKNIAALEHLRQKHRGLIFFWHEEDQCTLTSTGLIWVHPRTTYLPKGSICVMPELRATNDGLELCSGICSDTVEAYVLYRK